MTFSNLTFLQPSEKLDNFESAQVERGVLVVKNNHHDYNQIEVNIIITVNTNFLST